MKGLAHAVGKIRDIWDSRSDAFGTLIADGTTNRGDLGSHFPYSPEAYRLYQDGERVDLQYDTTFLDTGETPVFRDEPDAFVLKPSVDETLAFQTAERFRYVVAYEAAFSLAWETSRPLGDDETVRLLFDGSLRNEPIGVEGHGIEFTSDGARTFITRDGTRIVEEEAPRARPPEDWTIYENVFNWYNVGQKKSTAYFSDGERQQDVNLGITTTTNERGPQAGNGRITVEVERGPDAPTEPLEVVAGSMGFKNLGQVVPKTRSKIFPQSATLNNANTYEPIGAIRVIDGAELVTCDLANILPVNVQGPTRFLTTAMDIDNTDVDPADFAVPDETNAISSAIEATTDITQAVDGDGNIVSTTQVPGGYQIGWSNSETTGSGVNTRTTTTTRERRRRIHDTDIGVIWAYGSSSGAIDYTVVTEQEW